MLKPLAMALATSVVLAGPAAATSFLDRFSFLAVFGDSISDPGNAFAATAGQFPPSATSTPPGPYFEGRFTNGRNYVDLLAEEQGLVEGATLRNYSFGGARADGDPGNLIVDLDEQVMQFQGELAGGLPIGGRAAALFGFGGNDAFSAAFAAAATPDPVSTAFGRGQEVANVLTDQVHLFDGIVGDIFLLNLGDPAVTPRFALPTFLGAVPPALVTVPGPGQPTPAPGLSVGPLATAFATGYNAQLAANEALLEAKGFKVTIIDADGALDDYLAFATASGMNTTQPCGRLAFLEQGLSVYDFGDATCDETDPASVAQSVWFDDVHLTTPGHEVLAATVSASIAPIPLPASGLLFGAGLLLLAGLCRRA